MVRPCLKASMDFDVVRLGRSRAADGRGYSRLPSLIAGLVIAWLLGSRSPASGSCSAWCSGVQHAVDGRIRREPQELGSKGPKAARRPLAIAHPRTPRRSHDRVLVVMLIFVTPMGLGCARRPGALPDRLLVEHDLGRLSRNDAADELRTSSRAVATSRMTVLLASGNININNHVSGQHLRPVGRARHRVGDPHRRGDRDRTGILRRPQGDFGVPGKLQLFFETVVDQVDQLVESTVGPRASASSRSLSPSSCSSSRLTGSRSYRVLPEAVSSTCRLRPATST